MLRNLSNMVSVEAAELRHSDARRDELQVYLCTDEISAEMRKLPQANIAGMAALDTLQLHSMMLSASALAPARTVLLLQASIPLTLLLSRLRPCSPFRRVPHRGLGAITNSALCRHLHVTPSVSHPSRPPLVALRRRCGRAPWQRPQRSRSSMSQSCPSHAVSAPADCRSHR